MGKTKKRNLLNKSVNVPLDEQIVGNKIKKKTKVKIRLHAEEGPMLGGKTSQKILKEAKKQQFEFSNDELAKKSTVLPQIMFDEDEFTNKDAVDMEDFADDILVNEDDENEFELFKNDKCSKIKNLADIILEKIHEKQNDLNQQFSDVGSLKLDDIDPRVKEMYEGIRDVMKRYRSGKIPKAFKIIPKLRNWEQILYLTDPAGWSAAAMYQGTRIFCSVLSQNMAQRFYNLVLLPRVRDDLCEYKRLNVHLYRALKKALFKPAAFMKGIILPLLESGDATLREAIIFGSVIARNSIPVLHSSACLLKICEMEYTGANSIFIRIILDKRYVLPYRVVDAAVFHFLRFEYDKRQMPVLWHQSFLTFVQRYKNDISTEQKEALLGLLKKQFHPKITPEIRRELQAASCRDIEMSEPIDEIANATKMFDDIDMEYSTEPNTT